MGVEELAKDADKLGMRQVPIIRIGPSDNLEAAIEIALRSLSSGAIVAFPTETFYGMAVDATNEDAIRRLFSAKKRTRDRPVLILISSVKMLRGYVDRVSPTASKIMDAFWPGGLTMVFEAGTKVSPLLTAGTGKIGIRLSSHLVATTLTRVLGSPITGTSANVSGKPACCNAQEVLTALGSRVDLILDGGEATGKIGSTVLDVTVEPPSILREGVISRHRLERFTSTYLGSH